MNEQIKIKKKIIWISLIIIILIAASLIYYFNKPKKDEFTLLQEKSNIELQKLSNIFQGFQTASTDEERNSLARQYTIQGPITIQTIDDLLNYIGDNPKYSKQREDYTLAKQKITKSIELMNEYIVKNVTTKVE